MRGKPITPANKDDAEMARILDERDGAAFEALRPRLSPNMSSIMDRLIARQATGPEIREIARILASGGLVAAAAAAFEISVEETLLARDKADTFMDMAAFRRALGMVSDAAALERVARRLGLYPNSSVGFAELDDGQFYVQCRFADPAAYDALMDGLPERPHANDPLRDLGFTKAICASSLWRERYGGVEDYSFFVMDADGRPVLQVECDVKGAGGLRCHEAMIALTPLVADLPDRAKAEDLAVIQLEWIANWAGCRLVNLEFPAEARLPNRIVAAMTQTRTCWGQPFKMGWIDLTKDEDAIHKGYRATTRHSVRWGRENVRIATHRDDIDLLGIYADLHQKANRVRPLSPEMLMGGIRDGSVTAEVGYYQDCPCGLVLTSHHGTTANDMATVRDPAFKEPVTHVLIHQAILDAKRMGRLRFDFGQLWDAGQMGDKMTGIARFKMGFASSYAPMLMMQLKPSF